MYDNAAKWGLRLNPYICPLVTVRLTKLVCLWASSPSLPTHYVSIPLVTGTSESVTIFQRRWRSGCPSNKLQIQILNLEVNFQFFPGTCA